jgi:tetratricopeptide (TPR) repeat protein
MKKTILILMFALTCNISFGQNKVEAEKLVDEGTAYHDKGDYDGAISRYDKALELDKDNLLALAEKAFSLFSSQKYEESIKYCQRAIETHSGENGLKTVYVTFGNATDALKKTDKSIEIYDEGIKQFPNYYQLYFNKGVTLWSVKKDEDAMLCFQTSAKLNPRHASSHNAIARLSKNTEKRIAALLAYCRFFVLESESNRAKENLESVRKLMKANVEETGKKSINISISPDLLGDTTATGKPTENSFSTTDMILSMETALDFDKKNKKKTEVERFIMKLETMCSSLKGIENNNHGFFWDYYVPYFIEMKDKKLIETFSYIVFTTSTDPDVLKWLQSNKAEVDKFYEWSKSFKWKTN